MKKHEDGGWGQWRGIERGVEEREIQEEVVGSRPFLKGSV